jgi:DNA-binding NarL/FixJ family response regulator
MATKLVIVDDHPIVREGLAMQIATEPDLELCGEAKDSAGALDLIETNHPDLVLVDIALGNSNGLDLIRRIRERFDEIYILVWSMYPENLYAERALRAGAQGYLNKAQPTSQVLEAIRRVLAGKIFISGEAADDLLHTVIGDRARERSPIDRLSNRELEAFELMGQGLSTESIASKMHVSRKTIETYRAKIKEKLGVKTLPELMQRAVLWALGSGEHTNS